MWCNTLLQCGVVDCLAGWDEQVQGKNYLLRRGVLELGEFVRVWMEWTRSKMSYLLWWWLVLFIEARVLFPNIRREGIPQRPI